MTTHAHGTDSIRIWPLTIVWFVMMAAMMAPTVWPWVLTFHRFARRAGSSCVGTTMQFAGGYLSAWFAYSLGAALLQATLHYMGASRYPVLGGTILLIAGGYQFAALKAACLTHCRSPLSYFLTKWRDGPAAAFQMGAHHGLFCVGCCWALMATMLAVGVTNVWWMGALAALTLIEQVAPYGSMLRRPLGLALLAAGALRLA